MKVLNIITLLLVIIGAVTVLIGKLPAARMGDPTAHGGNAADAFQWEVKAGYQAMMVTDTAPWRYPHYHTAEDTPDKLHFDLLVDVVNGLEGVVEALAS